MQEETKKETKPVFAISNQGLGDFIKNATEKLDLKTKELAREKEGLEQKVFRRTKEIENKVKEELKKNR